METFKPSIHRKCYIDKKIRGKTYPTAASLSRDYRAEFGKSIDPRTIAGDIADMRRTLNAPIKYDSEKKGYIYSNPAYTLNLLKNEPSSLPSETLEKAVLSDAGFSNPFVDSALFPETLNIPAQDKGLAGKISVLFENPSDSEGQTLESVLNDALIHDKEISIAYQTREGSVSCLFRPFQLVFIRKECFMLGAAVSEINVPYALLRLTQIRHAAATDVCFQPPGYVHIQHTVNGTIKAILSNGPIKMVLIFGIQKPEQDAVPGSAEYSLLSKTELYG